MFKVGYFRYIIGSYRNKLFLVFFRFDFDGSWKGEQGKIPDTFAAILGPIAMQNDFSDSPDPAQESSTVWGPQDKPRALDRIPEIRWSYGTLGLKQAHQHVLVLLPLSHPPKTNDIKHSSLPSTGILLAHPSEEPLAMFG